MDLSENRKKRVSWAHRLQYVTIFLLLFPFGVIFTHTYLNFQSLSLEESKIPDMIVANFFFQEIGKPSDSAK